MLHRTRGRVYTVPNENANGMIREILPKGVDPARFTDEKLRDIEFILNNRPRNVLGLATPEEVFAQINVNAIGCGALQA